MQRLGCECPEPQYCFTIEYNEEYAVDIDIEYFEAVAELFAYAEANGYELSDRARFCYIDGIWNKESVDEWLTEIQLPVKR